MFTKANPCILTGCYNSIKTIVLIISLESGMRKIDCHRCDHMIRREGSEFSCCTASII